MDLDRRACLSLVAALALFALAPAQLARAAETARGTVYEDRDGDKRRDPGEPGIPGVAVSNGREVVETDGEGRYELPIEPRQTLFVTKPSGYATPLDADNLPLFYYQHFPEGSDPELGLRFRGVAPTGPLPASIDFPLTRRAEPGRFQALLFADPQPQTPEEVDFIRDTVVARLAGTQAAFGITLGDVMFDDLALAPRYNALIGEIGVPWYNVPGNHDLNFLAPDDARSLETFQRLYGPPYYSFQYARAHVVVLDDVHYHGRDAGREEPHPRGIGTYEGRIGERQLAWLRRDLARVPNDRLVIVTMHIPLGSHLDPEAPSIRVADRDELLAILGERAHAISFAGHTHTAEHHLWPVPDGQADAAVHQHVIATVSGSWWSGPKDVRGIPTSWQRDGTPRGFAILEVDGVTPRVRFVPLGDPSESSLRIMVDALFHGYGENSVRDARAGARLDGEIAQESVPSAEVLVNLFDGGPRSEVEMSLDGGAWTRMERVRRADPFVEELFAREADGLKSWVRPVPSSHLFAAGLPEELPAGIHVLRVRAVDEYGARHEGRLILEVVPGPAARR